MTAIGTGRLETFSTARHHLGFHRNVSCAAAYSSPSSPSVPLQTIVHSALGIVIARHPILSAIPLNEDKSFPYVHFAHLPSIDLRTCVEFVHRKTPVVDEEQDEELDRVLQEQHNRNFKEGLGTKPVWRLIVLHNPQQSSSFTAAWVFHHAIADGTSGLVFHRAFLFALQTVSPTVHESQSMDPVIKSPNKPLLPPLEELHPLPISPLFLIKALLASLLPHWFDPRPVKLWTGGPISSDPAFLHTKLRSLVLSSIVTKQLLTLSRKNATTLTGTLQCIIASATLSNLDPEKFERVKANGPISMRRFMKWDGGELEDVFVNGMTEYNYVHARSASPSSASSFSWDEARSVRAAIQTELDKNGNNSVVGLLRYVSDIHKLFTDKIGQERANSFEMSNIGAYKAKQKDGDEGWRLGRVIFSQCPNVTGPAFAASVATGGDGCAVITFTWFEGIVEGEMMDKVARNVEREIEVLLEEGT